MHFTFQNEIMAIGKIPGYLPTFSIEYTTCIYASYSATLKLIVIKSEWEKMRSFSDKIQFLIITFLSLSLSIWSNSNSYC